MTDGGRIACGIVLAAVVLAVVFVGYREFDRQRNIAEAQAAMQGLTDSMQNVGRQFDASRQVASEQAARVADASDTRRLAGVLRDAERRHLAANQRCVGGSVVQVDGRTFTQIGSIEYPVHCAGDYADRPIR